MVQNPLDSGLDIRASNLEAALLSLLRYFDGPEAVSVSCTATKTSSGVDIDLAVSSDGAPVFGVSL